MQGDAGTGKSHLYQSNVEFFHNNNALTINSKGLQHNSNATPGIASVIDDILTNYSYCLRIHLTL